MRALGTPKPSVQWFKDDIEIFSCDRIEMREEEEGGVVVLKGARLSDSGHIKCVATNLLGKAVSTAELVIESGFSLLSTVFFSILQCQLVICSPTETRVAGELQRRAHFPRGGDDQDQSSHCCQATGEGECPVFGPSNFLEFQGHKSFFRRSSGFSRMNLSRHRATSKSRRAIH